MRFKSEVCAGLLAAALMSVGCSSTTTSEQMAEKHDKEQQKLAEKQKVEQETLAKEEAKRRQEIDDLKAAAATTVEQAKRTIESISAYFDDAVGYAVFPTVSKGGLVVGAAHGNGVLYERRAVMADRIVGTAQISQGSIGFQIGGQTFSEIIFFEDEIALDNFKQSKLEFSGTASGVAGGEGGTAVAKYENGVAVFVFGQKGLMGEASIGGQKFKYTPLE